MPKREGAVGTARILAEQAGCNYAPSYPSPASPLGDASVAGADVVVHGFQNQVAFLRFVFAEADLKAAIVAG